MRRYRVQRGYAALQVPDFPSKEDFYQAYERRFGNQELYESVRLGTIPRETVWDRAKEICASNLLKDRQWMKRFLRNFGFIV